MAPAVSGMARRDREGMGDPAPHRWVRRDLAAVSGDRLSQRRFASGRVGNLVGRPKLRMG